MEERHDPAVKGRSDAARRRGSHAWSASERQAARGWTDADWDRYWTAFWRETHGASPARAPAAWPLATVLLVVDVLIDATAKRLRSTRIMRALVVVAALPSSWLRDRAERSRARALGFDRAADLPPAGRPPFVVPPRLNHEGVARLMVTIATASPVGGVPILTAWAFASLLGALRRRHFPPHEPWPSYLASRLEHELLHRWHWHHALRETTTEPRH